MLEGQRGQTLHFAIWFTWDWKAAGSVRHAPASRLSRNGLPMFSHSASHGFDAVVVAFIAAATATFQEVSPAQMVVIRHQTDRGGAACPQDALAGTMRSDHVLPRKAVAPNGGARRPWRALNFAVEKPAGTAGSTLVN